MQTKKVAIDMNALMKDCYEMQLANIKDTQAMISPELMTKVIEQIQNANKIYVVGMRSSFTAAYALSQGLNQLLGNCDMAANSQGTFEDKVLDITEDDLLIAISFPRYSKYTVELFKALKEERNVHTIAITAEDDSPMQMHADILIPCKHNSMSIHNSMSGAMFVVELILTAISSSMPEKTKLRLNEAAGIFKKLKFHLQYSEE